MKNTLTPQLLAKAKQAKNTEELIALAKENGVELTAESAKAYFDQLHKDGELADDELDQVAGGKRCGTTYNDYGQPETTPFNCCEFYTDKNTGERRPNDGRCDECKHDLGSFGSLGFRTCGCPERVNN